MGHIGREEGVISAPTYGEALFEGYLNSQSIQFEREPDLPDIPEHIDFVIEHATCGKVLLEVKDINNPPPGLGGGAFDPYRPIRTHIDAGKRKFRNCARYLCALVLAVPPDSFVRLDDPPTMTGAMYGNPGFQMSFNTKTGVDPKTLRRIYIPGNGKMVRKAEVQNTRIAALITVINYLNTENGRPRCERADDVLDPAAFGLSAFGAAMPGVTVWENAVASRKLPKELFRGEMDAWWEVINGRQVPTFIGARRRELEIDRAGLERMGMWPLRD